MIDSLTHAPAPAIFLANLQREYSSAQREKRFISILSISANTHELTMDVEITALARTIVKHLRNEEFFSRISETGYWIAVRGGEVAAKNLASRIIDDKDKKWRTSIIECTPSLTFDEWIGLADCAHFN